MTRHRAHIVGRYFDDEGRGLDRFGLLLILTVLTVGSLSLIDVTSGSDAAWPEIFLTATSLIVGATLVVALRASGLRRRWQHVAVAFVIFASTLSVGLLFIDLFTDADLTVFRSDRPSPIWVLIALVSPIAVIRRLTRHRRVNHQTLFGAIASYLLIAIGFTYLYMFVGAVDDTPFFNTYTEGADIPSTSYMYFSMVTITTLGYGDLSPASNLSRLLATTEAVVGQVYLVTFVAMVVGMFIQQRDSEQSSTGS